MPQVPYQGIPAAQSGGEVGYSTVAPTPAAFGSEVGKALSEVAQTTGRALDQVTGQFIQHQRQTQNSIWERQLQEHTDSWQEQRVTARRDAAGTDAQGYTQNFLTRMRAAADANLQRIPASVRPQWETRYRAVEGGFRPGVLQDEIGVRDATTGVNFGRVQEDLLRRANQATNETELAPLYQQAEQFVNGSSIPEGNRAETIRVLRQNIDYAYWQRQAQINPEQTAARLGTGTHYSGQVMEGGTPTAGFLRELDRTEGRTRNPASSANGYYQFLRDTWNGYANSERGRAAGLRPITAGNDPRHDIAQARIAIQLYTQDSARALTAANMPITGRNLYMLHFLGNGSNGGGIQFLRALQSNPGASAASLFPEAAAANPAVFYQNSEAGRGPRTVAQVFNTATRRFSDGNPVAEGPNPASLQGLTLQQRQTLETTSTTAAQRNATQETARQNAQAAEVVNNLTAGIADGRVGRVQIEAAFAQGLFHDAGTRNSLNAQVDRRDGDLRMQQEFAARTGDGGSGLNPHVQGDRQLANAAYGALRRSNPNMSEFDAGQEIFRLGGVMPSGAADAILHASNSTNQQTLMSAAAAVLRIANSGRSTNPFAGMENAEALRIFADQVTDLNARTTGPNAVAQIAETLAQRNLPDSQRTTGGSRQATQEFERELRNTDGGAVRAQMLSWFERLPGRGAPVFMPGMDQFAVSDYIGFARDHFDRYADRASALTYARTRMQHLWGNSNGYLTRMPPERAFPTATPPEGGPPDHSYIYRQTQRYLQEAHGLTVPIENIQLQPLAMGQTADRWRAWSAGDRSGEAPPYAIVYRSTDPLTGQQISNVVNIPGTFLQAPIQPNPNRSLNEVPPPAGQAGPPAQQPPATVTRAQQDASPGPQPPMRPEDMPRATNVGTSGRGTISPEQATQLQERAAETGNRMQADAQARRDQEIFNSTQPLNVDELMGTPPPRPTHIRPAEWERQLEQRRADLVRQNEQRARRRAAHFSGRDDVLQRLQGGQ